MQSRSQITEWREGWILRNLVHGQCRQDIYHSIARPISATSSSAIDIERSSRTTARRRVTFLQPYALLLEHFLNNHDLVHGAHLLTDKAWSYYITEGHSQASPKSRMEQMLRSDGILLELGRMQSWGKTLWDSAEIVYVLARYVSCCSLNHTLNSSAGCFRPRTHRVPTVSH